jgi:protein-disulfide isomerase
MIGAGGAALGLAVIATVQLGGGAASAAPRTPADVQARDPQFFEWYSGLPRVGPLPEPRHVKGPEDAPINIVEFSDFECTYCAKAFRDLRDLERRYPGQVRVSFHHYPLDSACNPKMTGQLHTQACLAAIAAECAARYGKFWEYHDRLFAAAQGDLSRPALLATAATLGIEATDFSACLDDPAVRALVLADTEAGAALGVQSTPTIIVNGRSIEGALDRSAYDYVMAMELHS